MDTIRRRTFALIAGFLCVVFAAPAPAQDDLTARQRSIIAPVNPWWKDPFAYAHRPADLKKLPKGSAILGGKIPMGATPVAEFPQPFPRLYQVALPPGGNARQLPPRLAFVRNVSGSFTLKEMKDGALALPRGSVVLKRIDAGIVPDGSAAYYRTELPDPLGSWKSRLFLPEKIALLKGIRSGKYRFVFQGAYDIRILNRPPNGPRFHQASSAAGRFGGSLLTAAGAYLVNGAIRSLVYRDSSLAQDSVHNLARPGFWASLGVFSGISTAVSAALPALGITGALCGTALPLAAGMTVAQVVSGSDVSGRDIAISTGAYAASGLFTAAMFENMALGFGTTISPGGRLVRLATAAIMGGFLEDWIHLFLVRSGKSENAPAAGNPGVKATIDAISGELEAPATRE